VSLDISAVSLDISAVSLDISAVSLDNGVLFLVFNGQFSGFKAKPVDNRLPGGKTFPAEQTKET
jgi:hypothetical protein